MQITEYMTEHGHQLFAAWTDPASGIKAFIAIHDTTLGPALGGTRIWPHETEEAAIMDVLRLSRAMTYKSAAAGLPLGGGKGLILADSHTDKTEALLRSYGRFVDTLGGRYITTEDVGAVAQDMEWVSRETKHVVGLPRALGGSGNPSVATGFGLFHAMRACAEATWGSDSFKGRTIAVQGFGNVATALSGHLLEAGAKLVVTDINEDARKRAAATGGVTVVAPEEIYDVECDVFAPCALGGVLNAESIRRLRCAVVCGGANNQLAEDGNAERLRERGILYAPDYIVNAGGVINVSFELGGGYDEAAAMEKTSRIHETMAEVIRVAHERGITTADAADAIAEGRLEAARKAKSRD